MNPLISTNANTCCYLCQPKRTFFGSLDNFRDDNSPPQLNKFFIFKCVLVISTHGMVFTFRNRVVAVRGLQQLIDPLIDILCKWPQTVNKLERGLRLPL